jgi:transposase InsO family protein
MAMSWKQVTIMSQRKEFVTLALQEGANITELCNGFEISRKTGYKWIKRFLEEGDAGLQDRSRQPHGSPKKTARAIEADVIQVRKAHPAWGGRKIHSRLQALGRTQVPAASTITAILNRHGLIDPEEAVKHKAWQRFEAGAPNDLWQMDFKGHFPAAQGQCHPLTVLDDHSRYSLGLKACGDERDLTVRGCLTAIFRRYGLPRRILVDNGSPWGLDREHPHTTLTVWLMRLGIAVTHARPYHPQTLGKDERFHRTLKAEVLHSCQGLDLLACQRRFDAWRPLYNHERPHEALNMATPASRYRQSPRRFPKTLPPIEYGPDDRVRKVFDGGFISYRNREYRISKAFTGEWVALRPTLADGIINVFFGAHIIAQIKLRDK